MVRAVRVPAAHALALKNRQSSGYPFRAPFTFVKKAEIDVGGATGYHNQRYRLCYLV